MKIKVELEKDETIEQAEHLFVKSVQTKQECSGDERYADDYLNELEAFVCAEHRKVLDRIAEEIVAEVNSHANQ